MIEEINRLRKENESLGGTFEARAWGLVPGLGSYVSWKERLDGRIAQAMVSIQSVKGVSIGPAWEVAASPGSEAHDEIFHSPERGYFRETNRAGGLEGGMTNGETLIVQVAIKPISTLTKPLRSVDVHTKEPQAAHKERTDSTVVPAAGVVGEAMLALTLARAYREKFGGDHIDDVRAAIDAYRGASTADRVSGPEPTSIVFIGFMGAGKSTAARAAARVLGADYVDTDDLIAAEIPGGSIAGFFREHGEARFRELEERVVLEALERPGAVVALGGGAVESERVRAALAGHVTAWCRVEEEVAWERCSGTDRPLARDRDGFRRRYSARLPLYEQCGRVVLPTGGEQAGAAVAPWLDLLRGSPGVRMYWSRTPSGDQPALVGSGATKLLDAAPAALRPGARLFGLADRDAYAAVGELMPAVEEGGADRGRRRRGGEDPRRGGVAAAPARRRRRPPRGRPARLRRRRRRRPRRLLRRRLPARGPGRPGADDARRPGRLGLRRQDRGGPAGGQELRRRLPPARGRAHRPGRARDPAGRRARGGLRRGRQDGADRRRPALGAGPRAGGDRRRVDGAARLRLRPHEARHRRRRRARLRPARGAQPRPHRRPRDRGGEPATPAIATARRSRSGSSRRSGSPAPASSSTRSASCSTRAGLPVALDPAIDADAVLEAIGRDKKRTAEGIGFVTISRTRRGRVRAADRCR